MFRAITSFLDHRTGLKKFMDAMLLEHIPGGAKWRYVWGSTLSFVFAIQVITGIMLMTAYSPSKTSAWESVFFIQYQMDFGWLIRGLHHFGSQTMVVLIALHMLQVVIAGAHLAPREINWWLGLGLLGVVLGLSLTGYLLPWDQKGYWATRVATQIAGGVPLIGPQLQRLVVGGPEYGHATLTRFFALHVGILPAILVILMIAHIAVFRRHGVTHPKSAKGEGWFWPDQAFRDLLVSLIIFGIMVFLVFNGHGHPINGHAEPPTGGAATTQTSKTDDATKTQDWYEYWAKAGQRGLGANLDAPADRSVSYEPRPEWYFLFLFQLLKYFEGDYVLVGTVIIPTAVAVLLFLLPLFGYGFMRPIGHILGVLVVTALITGVVTLTCLALAEDTPDPIRHALLTRIGLYVAPLIALVLILFLAMTAVLPAGGFRAIVSFIGTIVMTVLVVFAGLLLYLALTETEIPEQVAEFMNKEIARQEHATDDSKKDFDAALEKARNYRKKADINAKQAARAIVVAAKGIPAAGANVLLYRDPKARFQAVFMKNCASCHSYGEFTEAAFKTTAQEGFAKAKFTASDLAGFGTQEWIYTFLLDPSAKRFYGRTLNKAKEPVFTDMSGEMQKRFERAKEDGGDKGVAALKNDFKKIAAWLAKHPTGTKWKNEEDKAAFMLFTETYRCTRCHAYEDVGRRNAPDLTGYGSKAWLTKMLHAPGLPSMYGYENRMPTFRDTKTQTWPIEKEAYETLLNKDRGEGEEKVKVNFADISAVDREILVRFLAGDYRLVFGGEPLAAAKKKE